jgi:hypothetical protein
MSQMFIISIYFAQTSFKRPLVLEDHIFVFAIGMISNISILSVPDEGYSNILILSVPDEGYSRNAWCTLNLISTFLFHKIRIRRQ